MTSQRIRRFTRIRTLFEGALELPLAERQVWLDQMCEDEEDVRAEVEDLLRRIDRGGELTALLRGLERE